MLLFYDGNCPICQRNRKILKKYDKKNNIEFIDIHNTSRIEEFKFLNKESAQGKIHALTSNGNLLSGVDAIHAAYTSVGLYFWVFWIKWPIFNYIAKIMYKYIAKNRLRISRWLNIK